MAATAARRLSQPCRAQLRHHSLLLGPRRAAPTMSAATEPHASTQTRRLSSTTTTTTKSTAAPPANPQGTAGRFSYSIAASYIAKDRPFDPSTHVFHFNPYNRVQQPRQQPRNNKASRPDSGQDAFFVSRLGQVGGGVALGVADGVGGWMDSGVDPADFSHSLCDYAAAEAYGHNGGVAGAGGSAGTGTALTARQLMQRGYEAVCSDPAIPAGGSTAVVGLLGDDGTLEVANLGDSGFIHLRLNGVHAHSAPQTHAFNTPFQLSVIPPSVMQRVAAFGGAQLSDLPRDAEVSRHALRHGDVLVFATDGLWDNLFNQDILRIVSRTMTRAGAWTATDAGIEVAADMGPLTRLDGAAPPTSDAGHLHHHHHHHHHAPHRQKRQGPPVTLQGLLATGLVGAAKAASVNTKVDGPFAKEVKKYYPLENWRGGKVDDICVIVVVVSETQDRPAKARL